MYCITWENTVISLGNIYFCFLEEVNYHSVTMCLIVTSPFPKTNGTFSRNLTLFNNWWYRWSVWRVSSRIKWCLCGYRWTWRSIRWDGSSEVRWDGRTVLFVRKIYTVCIIVAIGWTWDALSWLALPFFLETLCKDTFACVICFVYNLALFW